MAQLRNLECYQLHHPAHALITHRSVPVTVHTQEVDAIAANTDKAQGPVFRPSRTDYQDTFTLGAKDSKQRTQYDTGAYPVQCCTVTP